MRFNINGIQGTVGLSGGMALTSDYVWRGSSQTRDDPAAQASLKHAPELGARYPLNDSLRLEGTIVQYVLNDDYADSYIHDSVGLVWALKAPFDARLTLQDADSAAKRLFPGMAGSRIELAPQAAF